MNSRKGLSLGRNLFLLVVIFAVAAGVFVFAGTPVPSTFSLLGNPTAFAAGPQKPVANAGADITADVGAEVTLDGSASQGYITYYIWQITSPDGESVSKWGKTVTFKPEKSGKYEATLTVYGGPSKSTDTSNIFVGVPAESTEVSKPAVTITHIPDSPIVGQNVVLKATVSGSVPISQVTIFLDGQKVESKCSDTSATGKVCFVTASFNAAGVHTYFAVAVDNLNNVGRDPASGSKSFKVLAKATTASTPTATGNKPPVASAEVSSTECNFGEACSFSGVKSTDLNGRIIGYVWNFGDGTIGIGGLASHTYEEAGTYTVTLKVVDNLGAFSTAQVQVTVSGKEATPSEEEQPTAPAPEENVSVTPKCGLEDFKKADLTAIDVTFLTESCGIDGSFTLDILRSQPSTAKLFGESVPPSRDLCNEVIPGWGDGKEVQRAFCPKDSMWYLVTYPATLSRQQ